MLSIDLKKDKAKQGRKSLALKYRINFTAKWVNHLYIGSISLALLDVKIPKT